MARDFAERFYKSGAWRKLRAAYIVQRKAIDGGLCEVCRCELGVIVHHVQWITPDNIDDTNVTLSMDNLRLECQQCHNREREETERVVGRVRYDADGNITAIG